MNKCPYCLATNIDYLDVRKTKATDYTVALEDGELEWEPDPDPRGNDEEHTVVNCPMCGQILFSGDDDMDATIEDFLKGCDDEAEPQEEDEQLLSTADAEMKAKVFRPQPK